MKKLLITLSISAAIILACILGIRLLMVPGDSEVGRDPDPLTTEEKQETGEEEAEAIAGEVMRSYSNGVASFQYDSSKLFFQETPSMDESGYPAAVFYGVDMHESQAELALPQVVITPLVLTQPFPETTNQEEWEAFAKAMILGFYIGQVQEKVQIEFSNTVVKVEGTDAKMYVAFTSMLEDGLSFSGAIRMVANEKYAVMTMANTEVGKAIPQEMHDLYMSAELEPLD